MAKQWFRVHVSDEGCTDVTVEAENETEAEEYALMLKIPRDQFSYETTVTDVTEIDKYGNEIG